MVKRVVVLGGGMAGLSAAWELSRPRGGTPGERPDVEVTVHQRDGILGGKGSSVRGARGRIEEHGLHIWMGYYENAFRLMREVYAELDRPRTRPACPIRTMEEAFEPVTHLGVGEQLEDGGWRTWLAQFPLNRAGPGEEEADPADAGLRGLAQVLRLAGAVIESAGPGPARLPAVTLTPDPTPPPLPVSPMAQLVGRVAAAELAGLAELVSAAGALPRLADPAGEAFGILGERLAALRSDVAGALRSTVPGRRMQAAVDLLLTCALGAVRDGLLASPVAYRQADDVDFRDWLVRHGAQPATAWSPIVEGMYDLVFAYRNGDRAQPAFSAGLGVVLATRLFFTYRGAVFWRLRAGMGEVVFAPLYEALRRRGVRFELHSELVDVVPTTGRRSIDRLVLRQRRAAGGEPFEPLVDIDGLPCFPSPSEERRHARPASDDVSGHVSGDVSGHGSGDVLVEVRAGRDFDTAVLAVPAGALPAAAARLVTGEPAWADMIAHLGVVATQALQVWFSRDEAELSFPHPGAILSGYAPPFDTCASMSHLLPREAGPGGPGQPPAARALAYFCGVLGDGEGPREVAANARRVLSGGLAHVAPGAVDGHGRTDWHALHDAEDRDGDERSSAQYWRANDAPWDGYVQSLPGSGRFRLRADGSGFDNLVLAGDWIDSGLNAGCIEAAVVSGVQAANATIGRRLGERVLGGWEPVGDRVDEVRDPNGGDTNGGSDTNSGDTNGGDGS